MILPSGDHYYESMTITVGLPVYASQHAI